MLYRISDIPVYQNVVFDSEADAVACPKGEVVLAQDPETGLVRNISFDVSLVRYDIRYQNEQANSPVFQNHLESVADIIDRHFGTRRPEDRNRKNATGSQEKDIIEIGCGKGSFLERLLARGYDAFGVDPAYEGNSPHVLRALFNRNSGISADVVILRHVLEHVENPVDFLARVARANGNRGSIYIEVPCLDWIIGNRAWFDIFFEHVNYFRLGDFRRMFGVIHEAGRLFMDQYIYVVADLASLTAPGSADRVDFPADFLSGMNAMAARTEESKRRAIWGAAAKGMMVALSLHRIGLSAMCAIDINPAKQGKFLAGSGLKVAAPQEAMGLLEDGDDVIVVNGNYLEEIIAMSNNRYRYLKVDDHELS